MRGRLASILASALFLVIAPGTFARWIPWRISMWRLEPALLGWRGTRVLGAVFVGAGLVVLVDSFARFALEGRGTPAPLMPTERLVASGWYRYVRNPMYVAVVSAILGQALFFASRPLLLYAAVVWLAFYVFVLGYEEPTLRARYGREYEEYCAAVRRWWPRLRPFRGPGRDGFGQS
jgi:protein-S-isoprenylcysteine O-methyltransferase Ste14